MALWQTHRCSAGRMAGDELEDQPRVDLTPTLVVAKSGGVTVRTMPGEGPRAPDRVRAAEVVGTLCLATDLGMGFPFEHGLQTTLIASRLAQRLGVDHETERRVYYGSLLAHAGCTTDAHVSADIFGSPLVENLHPVIFGSQRDRW